MGRRTDDGWWEVRLRVRFSEVDAYRVVWHGRYLSWFEEARNDLARCYGFTPSAMADHGYQLPVREVWMSFKSPARLEDEVLVTVRHRPTDRAVLEFDYQVHEAVERRLLVTGRTQQVVTRADNELLLTYPVLIREILERLRQDQGNEGSVP